MTATDQAARQADLLWLARRRVGAGPARTGSAPAGSARTGSVPAGQTAEGPAPLSHAQQRMWLMDRLGQGGAGYHVPLATRLRGPLDTEALAAALTALTARHTVLRTRYGQRGDHPYQEAAPATPVPVPVLPATPEAAPALLRTEAGRPFDLATGPVLRALLLRHGQDDHTLLLTLHHIAVDGGSLPVLAADLAALYRAALTGQPADLPPAGPQYADYARWERSRDAELAAAAGTWAARLTGARPVPLLRPVPPGPGARPAALHTAPLTPETLDGLRRLGTRHGATLFTVVLAAAFATLRLATGEPDLTVGCASGHRARPELRRTVGLSVNTLPVRADLSGEPTFTEALTRVRSALLDAQERRDVPFDLVVERLGAAARGEGGHPLLAVSCDLVRPAGALALPGLAAEAVDIDLGLAKFGLALLVEDGPRPRCLVQHDVAALDEAAAGRLLTGFADLLTAVAADADRPLAGLPAAPGPWSGPGRWSGPDRTGGPAAGPDHPAVGALLADPRIVEAAVVAAEGRPALAYAVVRGPASPSGTELRAALRHRLPADRLPAAVTLVDALPRHPDGTVDRARLPGAPAARESEALAAVRTVFGELLSGRPTADADFFHLGGHSLMAVQLAERLRARTGLPLTGLDVLEQRTARALAGLLDTRAAERRAATAARPTGHARPAARHRTTRAGTVLLTGATGGVGAAVLQELIAQGRPVRALVRPESAHLVAANGAEAAEGDLADHDSLCRAVEGVDAVIHAACTFTEHRTDLAAMRTLVDGWRGGEFVFVSSVDAYGRPAAADVPEGAPAEAPVSPYGQTKLDCERILLAAAGTGGRGAGTVVRSPIVWGPHRRLRDQLRWGSTGALYQAALAGRPIVLPAPAADGHGWYGASWVHSAALARAVVGCADGTGRASGRTVNAVTGQVAWAELAAELVRLLGSPSAVELRADAEPELRRPWHYRAEALADLLRPEPGEDWRSVLAAMVR
ncbi:condensation domain-containing protein [Kitasatospora sp. NPDC087315]|uniref:condensation domain-containing protein n=1 Tax=Kitasatospora sp. NPDC087315 TaxID=3364069 RepID=UPI0037F7ABDE